jgi:hypothetical protein
VQCSGDAATVSENPEISDEVMMGMIQMANHKPITNHSKSNCKIFPAVVSWRQPYLSLLFSHPSDRNTRTSNMTATKFPGNELESFLKIQNFFERRRST